jgi:phage tail sheath protein FI
MTQPTRSLSTPGVYINEINAFPSSIMAVATAIPAFIGYTARASYNGRSYTGQPVPITSFAEFLVFFGAQDATGAPLPDIGQYQPHYYPVRTNHPSIADITVNGVSYVIEPDPASVYYFYNSIRLFFQNGGGMCYVVSVGGYGPLGTGPKAPGAPLINPNVTLTALSSGLTALEHQPEPTLVVIPEATLLSQADNAQLNQLVLQHCSTLGSRIGIFDLWHGNAPDPKFWTNDIAAFRNGIGTTGLSYGAAYYPFLKTGLVADSAIDYANFGGAKPLAAFLPDASSPAVQTLLQQMADPPASVSPAQIDQALLNTSPSYQLLHNATLAKINVLPPSAAMAGLYTTTDNSEGVWFAPANVAVTDAVDTTLALNDSAQGQLNVDPVTGKSINAIRVFPSRGVVVWGARTLDGNSGDWRYINVRRTVIMIEQSIKLALNAYTFAPNTANTWSRVSSAISNFLTSIWQAGGLMGDTPASAFNVAVGLGSTMTGEDILNGYMNVAVKVAIAHPAEFIVITFRQQMMAS